MKADHRPCWLIVGMTGRVGRMLSAYWSASPPSDVRILYQVRNHLPEVSADLIWSPVHGPKALLDFVKESGPVYGMIVLAGLTTGSTSELAENSGIAVSCLAAADAVGVRKVLIASSSAVYGASLRRPYNELDSPDPVNDYGRAKLAMENACMPFQTKELDVTLMRIGNVAGADALLLNAARATKQNPLVLDRFEDGSGPLRSYISPSTLARVLETMMRVTPLPEVVNVAAPRPVSMQRLAEAWTAHWTFKTAPESAHQSITLDCERLAEIHQFHASDSIPESMVSDVSKLKPRD